MKLDRCFGEECKHDGTQRCTIFPHTAPHSERKLEDCSGCTDPRSEGTHQGHTKQHPCPEGGDPNCGSCFPAVPHSTGEGWADEFDKLFTVDCAGKNPPQINCRHWKQEDNVGGVKNYIAKNFISREELKERVRGIKIGPGLSIKPEENSEYEVGYYGGIEDMKAEVLASLEKPKQ